MVQVGRNAHRSTFKGAPGHSSDRWKRVRRSSEEVPIAHMWAEWVFLPLRSGVRNKVAVATVAKCVAGDEVSTSLVLTCLRPRVMGSQPGTLMLSWCGQHLCLLRRDPQKRVWEDLIEALRGGPLGPLGRPSGRKDENSSRFGLLTVRRRPLGFLLLSTLLDFRGSTGVFCAVAGSQDSLRDHLGDIGPC